MFITECDPQTDPMDLRLSLNGAVGYRVPNGATILQSRMVEEHTDVNRYVVLCLSHGEFVTWTLYTNPRGDAETYLGHYHGGDLAAALVDYNKR